MATRTRKPSTRATRPKHEVEEKITSAAPRVAHAPDIPITAKPRRIISVDLVGVRYDVKPPKGALALTLGRAAKKASTDPEQGMRAMMDWLTMAVGSENAEAIEKRLNDLNDELDFEHIGDLIKAVTEAGANGNPTT